MYWYECNECGWNWQSEIKNLQGCPKCGKFPPSLHAEGEWEKIAKELDEIREKISAMTDDEIAQACDRPDLYRTLKQLRVPPLQSSEATKKEKGLFTASYSDWSSETPTPREQPSEQTGDAEAIIDETVDELYRMKWPETSPMVREWLKRIVSTAIARVQGSTESTK